MLGEPKSDRVGDRQCEPKRQPSPGGCSRCNEGNWTGPTPLPKDIIESYL